MQYDPQRDALPASAGSAHRATYLPTKSTVILIRWPVVLISCSLILFRNNEAPQTALLDAMAALYAFSNIGLYFASESEFRDVKFNVLLIGLDTLVLTASLMINGQVESNFYLAYFLLIIICSIFENPRMIATISLAAPFAYAGFF